MTHTNQTVGCIRKQILRKVKGFAANLKVELYINGEIFDTVDDKRLISEVPVIKDKMVKDCFISQVKNFLTRNVTNGIISVDIDG